MVHSPVCVPVVAFGLDSSQAASNSHDVNAVIVNTTIKRDLLKFYKVYGSKIFTKNIIFRKITPAWSSVSKTVDLDKTIE